MSGENGSRPDVERVHAELGDDLSQDGEPDAPTDTDGLPPLPERFLPATRMAPVVESAPGLARIAAGAALHTTAWGVRTTARTWLRLGRAVTDREQALALADDAGQALGVVTDLARALSSGTPVARALIEAGESLGGIVERTERSGRPETVDGHVVEHRGAEQVPRATLRERGADLLERSRDVWRDDDHHPAYDRILDELAPDEARVLVLLIESGPQPSVDVRTGGPIGLVNSQLLAPGLTMIGARAGVRHLDQVPAYLNNLFRLGLVWFSREPLRDPMDYQVLEAQPDVLSAMHSVKFARVVRRSIHLTPFGVDFVRTCLVEEDAADADFPEHESPPEDPSAP